MGYGDREREERDTTSMVRDNSAQRTIGKLRLHEPHAQATWEEEDIFLIPFVWPRYEAKVA